MDADDKDKEIIFLSGWHGKGFKLYWKSQRVGRPNIDRELAEVNILTMTISC